MTGKPKKKPRSRSKAAQLTKKQQAAIAEVDSEKVAGPASAADEAVARFDGTTGKLVQSSLVTISDVGSISLPASQTKRCTSRGSRWKSTATTSTKERGPKSLIGISATGISRPRVGEFSTSRGRNYITTHEPASCRCGLSLRQNGEFSFRR